MDYLLSIIAGLIQGLTEFLPVSSSGHLLIFHDIFGFNLPDNILFDVILHLGTLLALLLFFYKDIVKIINGFFSSKKSLEKRLGWYIIIGTIPAAVAGFFFDDLIEEKFRSVGVVAIMLIVVGILFWLFEKWSKKLKNMSQMTWLDSLVIGIAQAVALIPGVSRSGITIIAGLGLKMKRDEAARFSFLLSMPIIFGAGLKKVLSMGSVSDYSIMILLLGFLSSFVAGYFAIKYLLKFLSHHSLNIFALYRLVIGCLILIWLFGLRGL